MPRTSTTWNIADNIAATRLEAFNTDLDSLFSAGSDKLKVRSPVSGTALKVDISAGTYRVGTSIGIYAGATDITMTNTATNYVEIDSGGTIHTNTSGWTTGYGQLASVVCAGGVVTSITVYRPDFVGGTLGGGNPTVLDKTADYTATTADVGSLITNSGASAGVNITLPAAAGGLYYDFLAMNVTGLTIVLNGSDNIQLDGTTNIAMRSAIAYDTLRLMARGTGTWAVMFLRGNGWQYSQQQGYSISGNNSGVSTKIDKINFTNDTCAVNAAVVATAIEDQYVVSTSCIAYILGGTPDNNTTASAVIQKLTMYNTEARTSLSSTMATGRATGGFGMSRAKGYTTGGAITGGTLSTTCGAFTFSSETDANLVATIGAATWRFASGQSSLKHYGMSGSNSSGGGSATNVIRDLTFSSETTANNSNSFSASDSWSVGMSFPLAIYQFSGQTAATTIRKLTISGETTSNLGATLSADQNSGAGVSAPAAGYTMGGNGGGTTLIDKFVVSGETMGSIAAVLSSSRNRNTGAYPWII